MGAPAIEGYEIVRKLSEGGQGIVYQAMQKPTARKVAIKIPWHGAHASPAHQARFQREMKILGQLNHPNIITIFHAGTTSDGAPFYVMDYVRGLPLDRYVREHNLQLEPLLALFIQICAAVDHAHRQGVVHRDLKPSNILVDNEGRPRILDFGLASFCHAPVETVVTRSHDVIGTLRYMSPEHARGAPDGIEPPSDVYSLGVILYELLTGRLPYPDVLKSGDVMAYMQDVLRHIQDTPPVPLASAWRVGSGIPPRGDLDARSTKCPLDAGISVIVLRTLAKERSRRFQSAGELAAELGRYSRGEPLQTRPDGFGFRFQRWLRRRVVAHHSGAVVGAMVLAALAARFAAVPLVYEWTPAQWAFQNLLLRAFGPPASGPTLDSVRVIAQSDETDVVELARTEGLAGVDPANARSLRLLHGRLMERLAKSKCRVVAWDISFPGTSPYDSALLTGVQALEAQGVGVVMTSPEWHLDEEGRPDPDLTPVVRSYVRWGASAGNLPSNAPWFLALAVQRGSAEPTPSLAVAATAAFYRPLADFNIVLDEHAERIQLVCWPIDRSLTYGPQRSREVCLLKPSWIRRTAPDADPGLGIEPGDLVADLVLDMPASAVLEASTIEYGRVLKADEAQLQAWFRDKLVIIGNQRTGVDRWQHSSGRTLSGCYAHAVGADALLRHVALQTPRVLEENAIPLSGAFLGAIIAVAARGRRGMLCILIATSTFALAAAAVMLYRNVDYLVNPLVPWVGLIVACALVEFVRRLRMRTTG